MAFAKSVGQRRKERELTLRQEIWPEVHADHLWTQDSGGYKPVPRTMPLVLAMMDDLSKGKPISSTFFELWCRSYEESIITLSNPREHAFYAGFSGERAESTWRGRMKILAELGFIRTAAGPSGDLSYVLLVNPHQVLKRLRDARTPGLMSDKYTAMLARAGEVGAKDVG